MAFYGFSGTPEGMTTGPNGSVYVLGQKLVELKPDETVSGAAAALPPKPAATGVAALPDGSVITGQNDQVKRIGPTGTVTVLAGVAGAARPAGAAVPASAAAAGFHLSAAPSPFGVEPDGAVLIADQDTLWSLRNGTLKRLTRISGTATGGWPLRIGPGGAVDRTGTAYLSSAGQQTEVPGRLGAVVTVSAEGRLGKLRLPARITGLTGSPAEFKVGWPAGDDANGVFALVYDSSGDNRAIVHLHSGRADLVAHENARTGAGTPCRITHLVDALRLPCPLPMAMTYRSGSLILGGLKDFVLRIRVA